MASIDHGGKEGSPHNLSRRNTPHTNCTGQDTSRWISANSSRSHPAANNEGQQPACSLRNATSRCTQTEQHRCVVRPKAERRHEVRENRSLPYRSSENGREAILFHQWPRRVS